MIIVSLLFLKLGVSIAISLCYLITTSYFPVLNSSAVFSYLCAKAKFCAMLAPLVAELKGWTPLTSMSIACFFSAATAFLLKKHVDEDPVAGCEHATASGLLLTDCDHVSSSNERYYEEREDEHKRLK